MKNPKTVIGGATAGLFGLILMGQAFAGAGEPVRLMDPANPSDSLISAVSTVNEDDPEWNCLTMGNRECGPDFIPAPTDWTTEPDGTTHQDCLALIGDTTYVVCPDGYTTTS